MWKLKAIPPGSKKIKTLKFPAHLMRCLRVYLFNTNSDKNTDKLRCTHLEIAVKAYQKFEMIPVVRMTLCFPGLTWKELTPWRHRSEEMRCKRALFSEPLALLIVLTSPNFEVLIYSSEHFQTIPGFPEYQFPFTWFFRGNKVRSTVQVFKITGYRCSSRNKTQHFHGFQLGPYEP